MNNQTVVVYESEGQRMLDQWFWHGGGAEQVGWVALVFVIVVAVVYCLRGEKRRRF